MAVQLKLSDGETVLVAGEEVEDVLTRIRAAESGQPTSGETFGQLAQGFIELTTSKGVLVVNVGSIVSLRRS